MGSFGMIYPEIHNDRVRVHSKVLNFFQHCQIRDKTSKSFISLSAELHIIFFLVYGNIVLKRRGKWIFHRNNISSHTNNV